MAEILLMKAEALIWKGAAGYEEALEIINKVRNRARLKDLDLTAVPVASKSAYAPHLARTEAVISPAPFSILSLYKSSHMASVYRYGAVVLSV